MFRKLSLVIILSACLAAPALAFIPPVVVVKKLPAGSGPEAVLKQPASIPRFEYYVHDYLPSQQTEVRLAYDDDRLYIAFRCLEEQMAKLSTKQTQRDSSVWKDDSVSAMLDVSHQHKGYVILSASASGVQCDQKGNGERARAWNAVWSVETRREATAWTVLMTIPFKSLGVKTPKPGATWGVNFGRISVPFHERSCWTTINRTIMQVERWGHLVFGDETSPIIHIIPEREGRGREFSPCRDRAAGTCSAPRTPIGAPGRHPVEIAVANPGKKPKKLVVETLIDDRVIEKQTATASVGRSRLKLKFLVPEEGEHELKFAVRDAISGAVLMRTPYELVYIPKHGARVLALERLVSATSATTAEKRAAKALLDGLKRELQAAAGSTARWDALAARVRAAERAVGRLRAKCADSRGLGYSIGTETAITRVLRDEMFEGRFGEPVRIAAARNEFESAQAVVVAYGKSLENVSVSMSELVGPGGTRIPAGRARLDLVDWVKTYPPRYAVEYIGWIPDPLVGLVPFDVPEGGLRPVWVTVHPPEGIPAGTYRGTLTVKPSNAPESSIPVEVKVWDFTLPTRMAMKTAFALFDYEISGWYGRFDDAMRREWYAFLLDHRVNPTNIYSKTPVPDRQFMQYCADRGLNSFTLACTWYKEGKDLEELLAMIEDNRKYLTEHGWWDMPYIYGFDELGHDKYPELRSTYGDIKRAFPDLPTMTTVHPNPDLKGFVDIWVPLTANWIEEDAREYVAGGDQVWWYVCCHPFHPYPNFFIDYPAIDSRVLFWMNWKCKVPGVLYYAINIWQHNRVAEGDGVTLHEDPEALKAIAAGKRWPEVPWNAFSCAAFNGDGQLIYPGPNGKPYSSMRLEAIRDGIEDYEYFHQLSMLVTRKAQDPKADKALLAKARKLLSVRDDVVKSNHEYTLDPALLLDARREVAEMIEAISR